LRCVGCDWILPPAAVNHGVHDRLAHRKSERLLHPTHVMGAILDAEKQLGLLL